MEPSNLNIHVKLGFYKFPYNFWPTQKNVCPPMIYPLGNFSKVCKEIKPTYGSRGSSFDPCKTNPTHVKSKRKIFQNWKFDEQFIPWNTNPRKHIIHTNQEAKTPGSTSLKWLQYAQRFSNFTMIFFIWKSATSTFWERNFIYKKIAP